MTLTRLLEIDPDLLTDEEFVALRFASALWDNEGRPTKPGPLCRLLELILRTCQRECIRYPPILLRRKKELQRGVWEPVPVPSAVGARPARVG